MCNFIIRPIKSYATVDYFEEKGINGGEQTETVKRGQFVQVVGIVVDDVFGFVEGDKETPVTIPLKAFVHCFTANPNEVEKARKEEHKTMGYDPNKKESKDSAKTEKKS